MSVRKSGEHQPLLLSDMSISICEGDVASLTEGFEDTDDASDVSQQPCLQRYCLSRLAPKLSTSTIGGLIAIVNVLSNVLMKVSLPVFAGTMKKICGDTFVVLSLGRCLFPCVFIVMTLVLKYTVNRSLTLKPTATWKVLLVMGFTTTLNGIMVVSASLPERTPPYLQGILSTCVIPFTVLCRLIILRKGISITRSACTVCVLIGVFITVEPEIWRLPGSSGTKDSAKSRMSEIFWPMIFAFGYLPTGINGVVTEKELKKPEIGALNFVTWTHIYQAVIFFLFIWIDFIPWFGTSSNPSELGEHLSEGLRCAFSSDSECRYLALKMWIFITGYSLGILFQFLLIQYAESAVYAVVMQAMITPLATMFWSLFHYEDTKDDFRWAPEYSLSTSFTIMGLIIITPAVILYGYFRNQESDQTSRRRLR